MLFAEWHILREMLLHPCRGLIQKGRNRFVAAGTEIQVGTRKWLDTGEVQAPEDGNIWDEAVIPEGSPESVKCRTTITGEEALGRWHPREAQTVTTGRNSGHARAPYTLFIAVPRVPPPQAFPFLTFLRLFWGLQKIRAYPIYNQITRRND